MFAFYDKNILPRLLNWACGQGPIQKQRQILIPKAKGKILEIGAGSGLNLPFYNTETVENISAIEPSEALRKMCQKQIDRSPVEVILSDAKAENLPYSADEFDSVILTYTLCTIAEPQKALAEIKRVLKPDGHLYYCEHGKAPDRFTLALQRIINPIWKHFAGGCHLDRDIKQLLLSENFQLDEHTEAYLEKTPRFGGYNYWGVASLT